MNFYIEEISKSAYIQIHDAKEGIVHSIFKNTINISVQKSIITIQKHDLPKTPLSITIKPYSDSFFNLYINPGDIVYFYRNQIIINRYIFSLSVVKFWDGHICSHSIDTQLSYNKMIKILSNVLRLQARKSIIVQSVLLLTGESGMDEMGKYTEHLTVSTTIQILMKSLTDFADGKVETSAQGLIDLIGMGEGLTPSGDDFLIGFLSVLTFFKQLRPDFMIFYEFLTNFIRNHYYNTPDISRIFLDFACKGEFSEMHKELYKAIKEGKDLEILSASMRFAKIGHSSGVDGLAGVVYGMKYYDY